MKKILVKILIAVSVCFILSKMKALGIMSVYARDVLNKQPTSVTFFNSNYESTSNNLTPLNFMINRSTFYGQRLSLGSSGVSAMSFNFDLVENDFTSNYNTTMQFVFYSNGINFNEVPFRFYIRDFANHHSTCYVEGTRKYPSNNYQFSDSLLMEQVSTVYCPNVFVNAPGFQIYATGNYSSSSGSTILVGISNVTVTNNNENEKAMQDIANSVEDTNNFIKDDSSISNNTFNDLFGKDNSYSDTPITDLITLPVNFLQSFYDGFNSNCQTLNLGTLYGTSLVLPCINLENLLGSNLWFLIDMMFSLFLSYNIIMMCISIFDSVTSLEDGFNSLYSPKHGPREYIPKHGR